MLLKADLIMKTLIRTENIVMHMIKQKSGTATKGTIIAGRYD